MLQEGSGATAPDNRRMHLLIPHASALTEPALSVLGELTLPHLQRLLNRLWALLTPVHWQVGRDQVTLSDPDTLALSDDESKAFLDAVRPLFESEGFVLAWGAPSRWYAAHASFDNLPSASLDRVLGRNVDLWLPPQAGARLIRRLQNEVQMLLYTHALNDAREARGALPLNSFWLSGCGRLQPANTHKVQMDDRLRAPLLQQDGPAWRAAWQALDAGPLATALARLRLGQPMALTLCGERSAQRFDARPKSLWKRLAAFCKPTPAAQWLQAL